MFSQPQQLVAVNLTSRADRNGTEENTDTERIEGVPTGKPWFQTLSLVRDPIEGTRAK